MNYTFVKFSDDKDDKINYGLHRMIYECETKYRIVKDKKYVFANLLVYVSDKDLYLNILAHSTPVGLPTDVIYDVPYGVRVFSTDINMVLPDIASMFEDDTKPPIVQITQNGISFLSVDHTKYQYYVLTDTGNIKETRRDNGIDPSVIEFVPTKDTSMWIENLYHFMEACSTHFG
jgi:hypothetical protein